MRLQNNITIFTGNAQKNAQQEQAGRTNRKASEANNKTIFAGDFLGGQSLRDRIQKKREEVQKRALKIVSDAWDSDKKLDDEIRERQAHIEELHEDSKSALDSLKDINQMKEELKEKYGVDPDSEEQQELERMISSRRGGKLYLSDKEPTEYQSRMLELEDMAAEYRGRVEGNNAQILEDDAVVKGIRKERLKHHTMADAQKAAEDVMESLTDEILSMVVEEGKEHLDEEQEKREEQAESIKEKKEEQEEIQEKREEREEELEELLEEMPMEQLVDMEGTLEEVKRQIQSALNEVQLTVEDLKGAKVDTSL